MDSFLPKSVDSFLRRHPGWMMSCVFALAILTCWLLIGAGNNLLVYEGF